MNDLISRQAAINIGRDLIIPVDGYHMYNQAINNYCAELTNLPAVPPERHEIGYSECANAMLKMWIDNILTDGEYSRIMDKLNAHWEERRKE